MTDPQKPTKFKKLKYYGFQIHEVSEDYIKLKDSTYLYTYDVDAYWLRTRRIRELLVLNGIWIKSMDSKEYPYTVHVGEEESLEEEEEAKTRGIKRIDLYEVKEKELREKMDNLKKLKFASKPKIEEKKPKVKKPKKKLRTPTGTYADLGLLKVELLEPEENEKLENPKKNDENGKDQKKTENQNKDDEEKMKKAGNPKKVDDKDPKKQAENEKKDASKASGIGSKVKSDYLWGEEHLIAGKTDKKKM